MKKERRTIAIVKISKYGESVTTHDYWLDYYEWMNKQADLALKGIETRFINADCILVIKKEKES